MAEIESEPAQTLTHSSPRTRLESTLEDEWQTKLSSLQDKHKLESFQQQQEHLEQLRGLQTQLLRELSSTMSDSSVQDLCKIDSKEAVTLERERSTSIDVSPSLEKSNSQSMFAPGPTQSSFQYESISLRQTSAKAKRSPVATRSPNLLPHPPQGSPDKQQSSSRTPEYKILGPRPAWEESRLNCPPSTKNSAPLSPRNTIGGDEVTLTPHSTIRGDTNSRTPQSTSQGKSQSKVSLVAKHTKHVEDLKKYYESEILALRRQLEQVRPGALAASPLRGSTPASPAQRQLKFTSLETPRDQTVESQLWIAQSENERLKTTHSELQKQLDDTESKKNMLEGQLKRLEQHVAEWQERCEASERMAGVLQERLDTSRSQLHQQERLNGQLTSDLKMTTDELLFWKDQKLQDVEKLDQLFHEFEVLQEENQQVLSMNSDLKAQLEKSKSECATLRGTLDKYQVLEAQYQSTIRRLEDDVRHLEHVNNRLHSQATHYETGWTTEPAGRQHGHVTRSPQADHSRNISQKSPVPPPETARRCPESTPQSVNKPLTRRKWLETSIPGLLFGGEPEAEEKPTVSSPHSRLPSRMGPESNPARAANQSPRSHPTDNTSRNDERTPARYNPNEYSVDNTLKAVKDGSVVTGVEGKRKIKKKNDQSLEERVKVGLERVAEAEKRLAELQTERERLESALQRTPKPGSRITKGMKQGQLELEGRLEQVVKEIGSVRMVLRKHHAFKR